MACAFMKIIRLLAQNVERRIRALWVWPREAPFLRKQSDFAVLEVLDPSEIVDFHKNPTSHLS